MTDAGTCIIATLRGPSAVEMVKMMDDAGKDGCPLIRIFDEPAQLLALMAHGDVDFAVLPTAMTPMLHAKGIDFSAVATIIWGGLYVCGTDVSISLMEQLKGKTVSVMRMSPPEGMLRHLLRRAGAEPDEDLHFDYRFSTHKELADAAEQGLTELCLLPEPFVSQALAANGRMRILLDLGQEWQKAEGTLPPVTALLCKDAVIHGNPGIVREVTTALGRSCEWVKAHPGEAASMVAQMGIFHDRTAVEASIPRSGFDVVEIMTNN